MRSACILILMATAGLRGDAAPYQESATKSPTTLSPQDADFFESRVRPILAANCFSCHGPEKQQAGLRLDSETALSRGSDVGPVVVPGEPDDSPLILAIRHDDVVKMPPNGKLSDSAIADLTTWVQRGAPWPEGMAVSAEKEGSASIAEVRARHWSFQPVREPPIPRVVDRSWPTTAIDHFILAKLESSGLLPSPPADRRTLIRRATLDLIGLPPTPEEVDAFLGDRSPGAFERVVDRLLASPRYGERWGRYWLDVARYADTKGYIYTDREEPRYPFSYTYRDYVIRSFNEDLPYDRFLREQIAADCSPEEPDKSALAALGFLTLGRRFANIVHDVIDDRIDVVFRGTQALTVACARCHDHKYDPIPTADYYSLYGVFAGTTERTVRLVDDPEPTDAFRAFEEELRKREKALADGLEARRAELSDRLRGKVAEYLEAVLDVERLPGDEHYVILGPDELNPVIVRRWHGYLLRTRGGFHPVFAPWHAFASIPAGEFGVQAPMLAARFAASAESEQRGNSLVAKAFAGAPPASVRDVAARYAALFADVHREWQEIRRESADHGHGSPGSLGDPDREELRQVLYAADAPTEVPHIAFSQIETFFDEKTRVELGKLHMEIDRWYLQSPAAPPHALVLADVDEPREPRVFVRGDPRVKGAEVSRRFLEVLAGEERRAFTRGSGRLELADAITAADNPLTARVMVNRIWMHHFGEGIVRTPSDFGTRGERPTHPDLLDYLASRFREERWSIKLAHRHIMLSSVYRQQSADRPEARMQDPENRLLWRMSPQRLDWEAHRDSVLELAGRLDAAIGGRPVSLTATAPTNRRTVYGFIDRQDVPGVVRAFDFANPDQHTPQRHTTTVPQQALFLMNSPFVAEQARALAAREVIAGGGEPAERIRRLHRLVFLRDPTASELKLGLRFLASRQLERPSTRAPEPARWLYGYGPYPESATRVTRFEPLGHWTGDAWQWGPTWPDPDVGSVRVTRDGGHPGKGAERAVIRRWVAPHRGAIAITGKVRHEGKEGDGVLAAIACGRSGELGRWVVHGTEAEAKVERLDVEEGDAIDFIVSSRDDSDGDAFAWAPYIRLIEPQADERPSEWKADDGFRGPPAPPPEPLTSWEEYAQVLLLSNEFAFVD